ncbi:MAG: hypothetical protein AAGA18_11380 [Verrucomicrobiota bacterium]
MELWAIKIGIVLGLIAVGSILLQYQETWKRKLGVWFFIATFGAIIWFLTNSGIATTAAIVSYFAFPIGQAFMASRRMRFSPERQLKPGILNIQEFEEVHFITQEFKQENFSVEGDHWLKPSAVDRGFRLLKHREKPLYGAVAVAQQSSINLVYTMLGSRATDGSVWITWDYPLPFGFKMPPHCCFYRCLEADSIKELIAQHEAFTEINKVKVGSEDEQKKDVKEFFDEIFKSTMDYNLKIGMLKYTNSENGEVLYSWKGTAFITWQVLREMLIG